jgi:hypothetical protein
VFGARSRVISSDKSPPEKKNEPSHSTLVVASETEMLSLAGDQRNREAYLINVFRLLVVVS